MISPVLLLRLSALTALAACGGSEDSEQVRLRELRVQSSPYINYMHQGPELGPCNRIIIPFAVRSGPQGFPTALRATKVKLTKSDGTEWLQDTAWPEGGYADVYISENAWHYAFEYPESYAPNGFSRETILIGSARGCGPTNIREGDLVGVAVLLEVPTNRREVAVAAVVTGAH